MPTALPIRPAPARRLSWHAVARLRILVARLRVLNLRLHVRVWRSHGLADYRLLRLMRRWLACHEAIGALLMTEEPEAVAQVRAAISSLTCRARLQW